MVSFKTESPGRRLTLWQTWEMGILNVWRLSYRFSMLECCSPWRFLPEIGLWVTALMALVALFAEIHSQSDGFKLRRG